MNVNIESIGFKADTKLETFIEKKIGKLKKFNDRIVDTEVKLKLENTDNLENKTVEINMNIPSTELFAKRSSATFEEATDLATEALRKQLEKRKEKLRGR